MEIVYDLYDLLYEIKMYKHLE